MQAQSTANRRSDSGWHWKLTIMLTAVLAVVLLSSSTASATENWSNVPAPFPCNAASNSCVAHTGFSPTTSYWGQLTNTKGNCTNYAAFRLQSNGAARLQGSGSAITWRDRTIRQFGIAAVNGTPAVGSIAWWGTSKGTDGHVAYVERVEGSTIYISESVWDRGSRRQVLTVGTAGYPDAFLHPQDAPRESSQPPVPAELPGSPVGRSIAGDFNHDGYDDIVAYYDYGSARTRAWIFRGNATGLDAPIQAWDSGIGNWDWSRA